VLVRSMLRSHDSSGSSDTGEDFILNPSVASYLLYDALATDTLPPRISTAVAAAVLRREVPEQVIQLIAAAPPQTPRRYLSLQAEWGSPVEPSRPGDVVVPDEVLYHRNAPLMALLLSRSVSALRAEVNIVRNTLLDPLEAALENLAASALTGGAISSEQAAIASPMLAVIAKLLNTLRSEQEALCDDVARRLGAALCGILSGHGPLKWAVVEAALSTLRELTAAIDSPAGHAYEVIGPELKVKVLQPLASQLAKACNESGPSQEKWLQEFQEQWNAHQSSQDSQSTKKSDLERELLERLDRGPPAGAHDARVPEGRERCLRVLLCARCLNLSLTGQQPQALGEMPGLDEDEQEEIRKYQIGVAVHVGRSNRVKCTLVRNRGGGAQDVLYLLPAKAMLVLVRPDEQKPFFAVPVIAEPLRSVRFMMTLQEGGSAQPSLDRRQRGSAAGPLEQIAAPGANGDESPRALRLEVFSPCSPELQKECATGSAPAFAPPPRNSKSPRNLSPEISKSMPVPPMVPGDHSLPNTGDAHAMGRSAPLILRFSDERRKRVAYRIFCQSRHEVCKRMTKNLQTFLEEVGKGG